MDLISKILTRFSLGAQPIDGTIWTLLLLIWLVVIGCTLTSLRAYSLTRRERRRWMLMLVALPVIGLVAYLWFCYQKRDSVEQVDAK